MLDQVDLHCQQEMTKQEYENQLREAQSQLSKQTYRLFRENRSLILVFEGWDAAGKGGTIRRVVQTLDPRAFRVHPIAAPKGEDKDHHYLWRFWRRLPPRGEIAIFDRSWYGRVLVERVEGFAEPAAWKRAYAEINDFEKQLRRDGAVIAKYWLHISFEKQLERFNERKNTDYKSWKLTPDDWRNREKWPQYEQAVTEMLDKTHKRNAPWTIVAANSQRYARIQTIRHLNDFIKDQLN